MFSYSMFSSQENNPLGQFKVTQNSMFWDGIQIETESNKQLLV